MDRGRGSIEVVGTETEKPMQMKVEEIRRVLWSELEQRRRSPAAGDYANNRGGKEAVLYGVTGAANLYAELGFDMGDFTSRRIWAERINAFQSPDGIFSSPSVPQHATAMAVEALNLLGGRPANPVRGLAPGRTEALPVWLESLDWSGTHKDFWGGAVVILASGLHDAGWIERLRELVENRFSTERFRPLWCGENDPPARIISCIYHVLSAYDGAYLPYPWPEKLWARLMDLDYSRRRNEIARTICTDFDYIHLLYRLAHQMPDRFEKCLTECRLVFRHRREEWNDNREKILAGASTHDLYCYVIGWVLLQKILPDHFEGQGLYDTLNVPWVFRIRAEDLNVS